MYSGTGRSSLSTATSRRAYRDPWTSEPGTCTHKTTFLEYISSSFLHWSVCVLLLPLVHSLPGLWRRYRECKLYYYLEDDSIAVVEQKQPNSGLIQVEPAYPTIFVGELMKHPCLFCPSDNLEHRLALPMCSRASVRALSY